MDELIKNIQAQTEELLKEKQTPFRDVAIGGLHSAIHGIKTAQENLKWHAAHLAKIKEQEASA